MDYCYVLSIRKDTYKARPNENSISIRKWVVEHKKIAPVSRRSIVAPQLNPFSAQARLVHHHEVPSRCCIVDMDLH